MNLTPFPGLYFHVFKYRIAEREKEKERYREREREKGKCRRDGTETCIKR